MLLVWNRLVSELHTNDSIGLSDNYGRGAIPSQLIGLKGVKVWTTLVPTLVAAFQSSWETAVAGGFQIRRFLMAPVLLHLCEEH